MHLNRHHRLTARALIAAGAIAGGCGSGSDSPGVPSAASHSDTTGASSGASRRGGALGFAHCMRTHGIKDYPDHNAQGDIQIADKPGSDLDPNNPLFKAANAACAHLMPSPRGGMTVTQAGSGSASGGR